ncbi:MAG: HU family DNA-binding protein [Pseudonocardia sp.]
MNKAELITALAERLDGDRRVASTAVDGLLEIVVGTVRAGESVSILGFGVFEQRQRAARTARNPRTGEPIEVAAAALPAFRPGAGFRNAVNGTVSAPRSAAGRGRARPVSVAAATAPVAATETTPADAAPADFAPAAKPAKVAKAARPAKPAKDEKPAKFAKAKDEMAKPAQAKDEMAKPAKAKDEMVKPAKAKDGKPAKAVKGTKPPAKPAPVKAEAAAMAGKKKVKK